VEAEATYAFGNGLSVYGSGALIGAKYIAGPNKDMRVGDAPTYTAAIGTIWDNGKFFGSLMQKFVGDLYGSGNQTASTSTVNGQLNHIPGYNTTDLVFGIRGSAFSEKAYMRNVEIKAGILNAFDHRNITEIAGTPSTLTAAQSGNALTYAFLPGQMSFVSVKVGF
jgi:iron complex outermembrane receptor protein